MSRRNIFLLGAMLLGLAPIWPMVAKSLAAADVPPRLEIVVGENAPAIERRAAAELASDLKQLYQADARVVHRIPEGPGDLIIVGSPKTNPAVSQAIRDWPQLSPQGHLLKSAALGSRRTLVLGGGSPAATYWATAEFVRELGVRSMLYGDVYPVSAPTWRLEGYDRVLEPTVAVRAWHVLGASPLGTQAWGLSEHRDLLRQLARLKFNRLVIAVTPWQPFYDFAFQGIKKETGVLWYGWKFPVAGDTGGRAAFGGLKVFDNPDLATSASYRERLVAGRKLLTELMAFAQELGMSVALELAPFELPPEFAPALKEVDLARKDVPANDRLLELAAGQIRSLLETYPNIDAIYLSAASPTAQWRAGSSVAAAERRAAEQGWDGSARMQALLHHKADLFRTSRGELERRIVMLNPELGSPFLAVSLPPLAKSSAVAYMGHDTSTVLPTQPLLERQPSDDLVVRCACPGDFDLPAHLLSRNSFGDDLTWTKACQELLGAVCGEGVADRTILGFEGIEKSTAILLKEDPFLGVPGPGMLLSYYEQGNEVPAWWGTVRDHYLNAMNEMYRANTRAREGGRSYTLYFARRFEFGFEFMNCLEEVRKAGIARRQGDVDGQIASLEKAVEALYGGLNAMAAVTRSNTDRAIIATLNEFGYRPLKAELERVSER